MSYLSLDKVSKSFGHCSVFKDISVQLELGSRVLLLGSNGSGKSTFLKLCAGLLAVDSGTLVRDDSQKGVAYLGEKLGLYAKLSVEENLHFFGALYHTTERLEGLIAAFGLEDKRRSLVCELSKGLQYRTALARVFLSPSKLLLLDEPSSFLDDKGFACLESQLESLKLNSAVEMLQIIASHDVARFQAVSDRALLFDHGSIVSDSSTSSLRAVIQGYQELNR